MRQLIRVTTTEIRPNGRPPSFRLGHLLFGASAKQKLQLTHFSDKLCISQSIAANERR